MQWRLPLDLVNSEHLAKDQHMKPTLFFLLSLAFIVSNVPCSDAQVSPVRLKVSKHSKSDTKTNFRSADGRYSNQDKETSIFYTVDLTNVSGGAARDFVIKWAVLVKGDQYYYGDADGGSGQMRVVNGEKSCTLEFGKTFSFDTDVLELQGNQTNFDGGHRYERGSKIVGYSVEIFCNDQRVAADIKPDDTKNKIEQLGANADQKRHKF